MTTGIIYRAFNNTNNKSYIGQTIRTLNIRIKEHYKYTINSNTKFAKALRKYNKECWEWFVLIESPTQELDFYERYFIKELNTIVNGYNIHIGGNILGEANINYNPTIYELWHPEHGVVKETCSQLSKRSNTLVMHLPELINKKRMHCDGYVLVENKHKYNTILKLHEFYHPNHGIVKCTAQQLYDTYPQYFVSKECNVYELTRGKQKLYRGWCLAKNKDNYDNLVNKSALVTLEHDTHGIQTLRIKEFKNKYGLTDSSIFYLKSGKYKTSKGWKLPKENTSSKNFI